MQTIGERMNALLGVPVVVEVDGPLRLEGRITAVFTDYIVIEMQDTAHFVQLKSIKEISKSAKANSTNSSDLMADTLNQNQSTFHGQLESYTNEWLCVTRTGLDELQGVLDIVNSDYAVMINKDTIIFLPITQIICFHYPLAQKVKQDKNQTQTTAKKENQDQAKNESDNNSKTSDKNENKQSKDKNNQSMFNKTKCGTKQSLFADTIIYQKQSKKQGNKKDKSTRLLSKTLQQK